MTYGGIDRKRFEYLLSVGTEEFELRKFFEDSRIELIRLGAKVQNLPKGNQARVKTLAAELPPKTDSVVRSWFNKNLTLIDPIEPEGLVDEFKLYEELQEELLPDEARRLARSCLIHLFGNSPPNYLLDFLKTHLGAPQGKRHSAEAAIQFAKPVIGEAAIDIMPSLPQIFVSLLNGNDVEGFVSGLPAKLATFVCGLQAAKLGRFNEARSALDELSQDLSLQKTLEDYLRATESRTKLSDSARGFHVQEQMGFSGDQLEETDEVMAYCTNANWPSPAFLQPVAVVRGGQAFFIRDGDAQVLFPETGNLISFSGTGRPKQPVRGEVGVWRVAEHDTDKRTRYHIASEKRPIYVLRMVPFPSTDPDAVRHYLQQNHVANQSSITPSIYQLLDGLIVSARPERSDLSKAESFELGLLAWNSLSVIRLDGRLLILGPLPTESSLYECADLGSLVKAVFRNKSGIGALNKTQLRELAQTVGSLDSHLTGQRIARLEVELERLANDEEALETVIEHLTLLPQISVKVDAVVEAQSRQKLMQKNEIDAEISRLQKERSDWETKVQKQKEEHRKLKDETAKIVKTTFDKVKAEGLLKLVTEASIYTELSSRNSQAVGTDNAPDRALMAGPLRISIGEVLSGDAVAVLRDFGVTKRKATAFVALTDLAFSAGLPIILSGAVARPATIAWIKSRGRSCECFNVSVGIIEDLVISAFLNESDLPDSMLLVDANLSALDLYGRSLSDRLTTRLALGQGAFCPSVFLVKSIELGSLPIPKSFSRIGIEIDFDHDYSFKTVIENLDESEGETLPSLPTLEYLWPPARASLQKEFEKLDVRTKSLVVSILDSSSLPD